jgi:hypothetical protein
VKETYYRFVDISNKELEGSSPTLCHVIPKSVIFHRLGGRKLPVTIFWSDKLHLCQYIPTVLVNSRKATDRMEKIYKALSFTLLTYFL